jgi:tetratricopeptide (TPR) repeat protein
MADGRVIGITTRSYPEAQNLNLAVPSAAISRLLKRPRTSRFLWWGTSIKQEVTRTYGFAEYELIEKFPSEDREAFYKGVHARATRGEADDTYSEIYERNLRTLAKTGDQLALLLLGRGELKQGRYQEALKTLQDAANVGPGDHQYLVYYTLGEAYLHAGRSEEIIGAYEMAHKLRPNFSPALSNLCTYYALKEQYGKGLTVATELIQLMPRCSGAYVDRADLFRAMKQYQSALDDLDVAKELDPKNAEAYRSIGCVYAKIGDLPKAVSALEAAIALAPRTWLYHYELGHVLVDGERYAEAIAALQKAIALGAPEDFDIQSRIDSCRSKMQ